LDHSLYIAKETLWHLRICNAVILAHQSLSLGYGKEKAVKKHTTGCFLNKLLPGKIPPDAACYLAFTMGALPKRALEFCIWLS